jgi:hypothetical protein
LHVALNDTIEHARERSVNRTSYNRRLMPRRTLCDASNASLNIQVNFNTAAIAVCRWKASPRQYPDLLCQKILQQRARANCAKQGYSKALERWAGFPALVGAG